MIKKENVKSGISPRLIFSALLLGLSVSLGSMLLASAAIKKGLLGAGEWGLYSRLCLLAGAAALGLFVCLRTGRDRCLTMLASAGGMMLILFGLSALSGDGKPEMKELAISALVVALACILLCILIPTGRKRRKSRKLR